MLDTGELEDRSEAVVAVAGAVVCEHAFDRDAEAGEVGSGHVEEPDCRAVLLIGQDGGEADAAVIVDGDVEILVAGAAGFAGAVAVDAVAGTMRARRLISKWIRSPGCWCS